MRNFLPIFLSSVFYTSVLSSVMAQDKPQAASASAASEVQVVLPQAVEQTSQFLFPGKTEPMSSARVFTRATGIVQERLVDIGDQVKEGDLMLRVHVPDLDRRVDAARAACEQAAVKTKIAKTQAERSKGLLSKSAISQEEADQREADALAAEAAERVALAELAQLEELQRFAEVKAPFDGVVAARNIERGDRVRGDSATSEGWLFHLVKLDSLKFTVYVAPDVAMRLTPQTTATLSFAEIPGKTYSSEVKRTSRVFESETGTMRVELEVENADLKLPAGLTGTAIFHVAPLPGSFLVPSNTILTHAGEAHLAVVESGKVVFKKVGTGKNLGSKIEITGEGLSGQMEVIVNPNALLKEGDTVTVKR